MTAATFFLDFLSPRRENDERKIANKNEKKKKIKNRQNEWQTDQRFNCRTDWQSYADLLTEWLTG